MICKASLQRNPLVLPLQNTPKNLITDHKISVGAQNGKSESEILFDEILAAYSNVEYSKTNNMLTSEIYRVLDHVANEQKNMVKVNGFSTPKVIHSTFADNTDYLSLDKTPLLECSGLTPLRNEMPSPDYTSPSERWSSDGDEFESLSRNSLTSGDDGYYTAKDSIKSSPSSYIDDLDIKSALPIVTENNLS